MSFLVHGLCLFGYATRSPLPTLPGETNLRIVYFDGTKVQINEELRTI